MEEQLHLRLNQLINKIFYFIWKINNTVLELMWKLYNLT